MVPTPWNCALEPVMASQSKPVAWKSMGPLGSAAVPWHGAGATGAAAAGVGAGVAGTAGLAGVSVVPGVSVVVGADGLAAGAGGVAAGRRPGARRGSGGPGRVGAVIW